MYTANCEICQSGVFPHNRVSIHATHTHTHTHTGELAHDNGGADFIWERDHEERNRLWKARHDWFYAAKALQPQKKVGQLMCHFSIQL